MNKRTLSIIGLVILIVCFCVSAGCTGNSDTDGIPTPSKLSGVWIYPSTDEHFTQTYLFRDDYTGYYEVRDDIGGYTIKYDFNYSIDGNEIIMNTTMTDENEPVIIKGYYDYYEGKLFNGEMIRICIYFKDKTYYENIYKSGNVFKID